MSANTKFKSLNLTSNQWCQYCSQSAVVHNFIRLFLIVTQLHFRAYALEFCFCPGNLVSCRRKFFRSFL